MVDAAATSIERDGIACTSQLEQTLFDDMNGLCRGLMAELPAAGAATAKGHEPEDGERNAGNHGKGIVTLFGELPEIGRTCYWNADSRKGHYPFDDRLGLVGRYTPAAANEMVRYAVSHPYGDAADGFSRNHAFRISSDTIREVVGMRYDDSSEFSKNATVGGWAPEDPAAKTVCVMADGRNKLGKDAMREYKYYRSNVGRMKYDAYRANGWFIGSGVIESGCKAVIGERFKRSGMIWSSKGAKALLPLRTLYKSNRLEEFFRYLVKVLAQVDCAA